MTSAAPSLERCEQALDWIRDRTDLNPDVALILGTGLGGVAQEMTVSCAIPYASIPGFPVSTVESHAGQMLFGEWAGRPIVALQGRWHRYEGHAPAEVVFPVRVVEGLGASTLIVSNACGGLRPEWKAGDLMLISDHLNLMMESPLVGTHVPAFGPRFPDLSEAYDPGLRAVGRQVAARLGRRVHEGVYAAVTGPNLETAAEYRMLRALGADAVGMSTVPEVIVARQHGMRVLGLSVITDRCLPDALVPVELEEILAVAAGAEPHLVALLHGILEGMDR